MRVSNDIETALYKLLISEGISASAHAVPMWLGEAFPHVHVVRTGGYTSGLVVEDNNVDFDVYAADQADAMTAASNLCALVRSIAGTDLGGVPCYTSEVTTLPYNNPDPRHPTIGRATFKALIAIRVRSESNA